MPMNPVVHFEMPASDNKRVIAFYSQAFGWNMQQFGEDMGNYVLAETTPTENGRPTTPGAINGGFFDPAITPDGVNVTTVVISVENIESARLAVEKAGGKILTDIMDIPGIGRYTAFADTEGNRVGMLQPAPME
jgi:predicted enzyme related to lactoylglutathione lyase